jgi:hypothetical protein
MYLSDCHLQDDENACGIMMMISFTDHQPFDPNDLECIEDSFSNAKSEV